jgi:DNA polymerase I-like protein with 3'-5' exonuclease and polymerase domains
MELTTTPRGDEYYLVTERGDLQEVAKAILACKVFGLDIETTSLDPRDGKIRLIQISDGEKIYVVDLFRTDGPGPIPHAIEKTEAICIVQNLKFEQKWFKYHHCIDIWPAFDPFRASAIIYNGKKMGHNLYDLYARELDSYPGTDDLGRTDWGGTLTKSQYDYAADDVTRLHALRDVLRKKLQDWSLLQTALVEFGVVLPEAEVELNGIYLDRESWLEVAEANREGADRLRAQLFAALPNPTDQLILPGIAPPSKNTRTTKNVFNIDSPDQILKALQKMGLQRTIKLEDGTSKKIPIDSTAEILLAQYAAKYPVVKDLFKYREFSKNLSSFGPKFLEHISPHTGRVHPDYWPFTGAGRYSCSKPNLQQIPRDPRFRSCFRAAEGNRLCAADYAGVEMRIAAEVARARALAAVFTSGKDAHTNTAALINGISYEEVAEGVAAGDPKYKLMRQQAKAVNFGLLYGMGAKKLVLYAMANYGVTLSQREADSFRRKYFEAYPGLKRWHNISYRDGQRMGFTRTLNGRIRYLDPEKAYSEWFNTPVQGTGADGLKKSLRNVLFRLREHVGDDARIVHHVHDEIIVEAKDDPDCIREVKCQIEEGMKDALRTMVKNVPVVVDASDGTNWAEIH